MSVISELLGVISNATYGRDVRQAIIDAIQQCYNDATGNPESVSALVEQVDEIQTTVDTLEVTGTYISDDVFGLLIMDVDTVETDTLEWILNHGTNLVSVVDTEKVNVTMVSGMVNLDGVLRYTVSDGTVIWYQSGSEITEDTALEYISEHSLKVYVTLEGV